MTTPDRSAVAHEAATTTTTVAVPTTVRSPDRATDDSDVGGYVAGAAVLLAAVALAAVQARRSTLSRGRGR